MEIKPKTFSDKLKEISDEAYRVAVEEKDIDAQTRLINLYHDVLVFMSKNNYSQNHEYVEPK